MKAMQLFHHAPIESSPLIYSDIPTPKPGPNEIRIKINCCAICRTDLHVIEGELPPAKLPITPGHQIVGIVDMLGPGAERFPLGKQIGIAWLRHTCGQCIYCRSEKENLCSSSLFTGYHEHGGYAEYAIIHEDFAYEIPEEFAAHEAAPLLCAGIIGYRALKRANLPEGGKLGIYGFGSSAHIVIQMARHRGCDVFVMTRDKKHQMLARQMEASWVAGTHETSPHKFDSAIIFAPAGELVPIALENLKKGGTLSLAGIHMTAIPSLDYNRHLFYEKNISTVTSNTRQNGEDFLREAAEIPIKPRITEFTLGDANKALQALKQDKIAGTGVLIID